MRAELVQARGIIVGHNAVAVLMQRAGLQGIPNRRLRFRPPGIATAADLVDRRFARTEPDQLWVTDITEHRTREGKIYCCVVLDVWSRRVVGWSIDSAPTAALATNALGMAISTRRPAGGGIIHSDHGVQGGFKWPSQHLGQEVVRWPTGLGSRRFVRIGDRSRHLGGRRSPGARTGFGSGRRSLVA